MDKKIELLFRVYQDSHFTIPALLLGPQFPLETTILLGFYWGNIGRMEKKMETIGIIGYFLQSFDGHTSQVERSSALQHKVVLGTILG